MSRIGRLPITIPNGVTVSQTDGEVRVKGPKGQLAQGQPASPWKWPARRRASRADDTNKMRGVHGLARRWSPTWSTA
jgi:large subunit ribosomal protein L6